jgi:hypothetical protein
MELRRYCEVMLAAINGEIAPEDVPPDVRCLNPMPRRRPRQR